MLRFAYTIFYVADVAATIVFYEQAFGCARRFIATNGEYGELETGSTTLSFAAFSMWEGNLDIAGHFSSRDGKPLGMEIGFATEDVRGAYDAAVSAGAIAVAPPKEKPWGQVVAYVRDLNGFLVELCTPMG